MNIGILKEPENDNRVAILSENISEISKMKLNIFVENNAGERSFSDNTSYENNNSKIVSREEVISQSDILLSINPISEFEILTLKKNCIYISVFNPLLNFNLIKQVQNKEITLFSLDMIPRITRGQSMDILSSMATVSGYQAVLEAAFQLPRFFPMFITAAGSITPSKVLILGAGVAGLQAIATSRKLGAQVFVFDVRPEVKEQVESLGGKFIEVEGALSSDTAGGYAIEQTEEFKNKQKEAIHNQAIKSDVIICTAQIPGRVAPLLITAKTVEQMKPGSIIIDLAASTGGNCELTENNKTIVFNNIKIIGQSNYPSSMPIDASRMFGKNLINFLKLLVDTEGNVNLNFEDEIIKGCCIINNKEIINLKVKSLITN